MMTNPGPRFQSFLDEGIEGVFPGRSVTFTASMKQEVATTQETFLESLVRNLEDRFPSMPLLQVFTVLDPKNLPASTDNLASNRVKEIEILGDHFGTPIGTHSPIVDIEELTTEWYKFKGLVHANYRQQNKSTLWGIISERHRDSFPNLQKLACAAIVVPVSTAACERGFSTQNRIKSTLRNRLYGDHLDNLKISMEGPPIDTFDFRRALDIFKSQKQRRIFQ